MDSWMFLYMTGEQAGLSGSLDAKSGGRHASALSLCDQTLSRSYWVTTIVPVIDGWTAQ